MFLCDRIAEGTNNGESKTKAKTRTAKVVLL